MTQHALDFRAMPKIELHAHLTGSITRQCLHEIWLTKKGKKKEETNVGQLKAVEDQEKEKEKDLDDPLVVLPAGNKHNHDLHTFFPLFSSYIYRLVNDAESLAYATRAVVRDFALDGVAYLELRTTPRAMPSAGIDKAGYVSRVLAAIAEAEREVVSLPIRVRLILSVDRRNTLAEAYEVLELAEKFRAGGGGGVGVGGVVGIDLCGDVCRGDVTLFTPVMAAARAAGFKLTIHFAEAESTSSQRELQTILDWMPHRLGHVINVPDNIKARIISQSRAGPHPIGLEMCLSSNVQLNMTKGGFGAHHFDEWCKVGNDRGGGDNDHDDGGPVVMPCTDDVGIFESPLSNEWRLVQESFHLGRDEITALARRSIGVIFGSDEDKAWLREIMW